MNRQNIIVQSVNESSCDGYNFDDIIGFQDIKRKAIKLCNYDIDIMILGETGVGKEMFATAIHNAGPRKNKKLLHLDCSTIPSSLFETELFGYIKGAFTDAKENRTGKIEYANGGTIILDEVGNIPLDVQAKLLRIIEHKDFFRVGENKPYTVDVRFIFITNINLKNEIHKGKFREDLFYRMSFHVLLVPPLRKRKSEIPKIIKYYWKKWNEETNYNLEIPSEEEIEVFSFYDFPGNVRELIGLLQRCYISSLEIKKSKRIEIFKKEINKLKGMKRIKSLSEIVSEYIREVVNKTSSLSEASRILGIDRKTLRKKLR